MLKQLKFCFLILIIGFFAAGCNLFDDSETEEEKLPKTTQTGKNTFGCLVDGKAWVTETSIDARAIYQEGVLSIDAGLTNKNFDQAISLTLFDPSLTVKQYSLKEYPEGYGKLNNKDSNCRYQTAAAIYSGVLIITCFDEINFIISGTFEFEAYSDDCDKVIRITKGRFDLTYAP